MTDADAKQIALLQADDKMAGGGSWWIYRFVNSREEIPERNSSIFSPAELYGAHMHGCIHPDEIGAFGVTRYILRKP